MHSNISLTVFQAWSDDQNKRMGMRVGEQERIDAFLPSLCRFADQAFHGGLKLYVQSFSVLNTQAIVWRPCSCSTCARPTPLKPFSPAPTHPHTLRAIITVSSPSDPSTCTLNRVGLVAVPGPEAHVAWGVMESTRVLFFTLMDSTCAGQQQGS